MVRKLGPGSVVLFGVLLSLGSGRLAAQQSVQTYGVDSPSIVVVSAWDMAPHASSATWNSSDVNAYRFLTNGAALYGAVHVPQGARILSIELDACDSTDTGRIIGSLTRVNGAGFTSLAQLDTGLVPAPGCTRFAGDVTPGPETVDNNAYQYLLSLQNTTFSAATSMGAVRVVYQLQVSPAPAVATFNDVPTSDPGFQYIEALVTSGITAGCGGGNFCPDATLTRRQMAVFLAKALGLHWIEQPDN